MANIELEDFENVRYRIDEEGMDYTFDGYSSWSEIKDEKFHQLRSDYLKAKQALDKYIDDKIIELS